MDKEDGEMTDDDMLVDEITEPIHKCNTAVRYRADKNGVIVETLEKVDARKLEERAKRFGLDLTGNRVVTQSQIDELYVNFKIESGNERHFRFDSLHLNSVNGLTTREIFEYLQDYKPLSLEWIDEDSCNVVCQDHISAALALLVHSCEKESGYFNGMRIDLSHHWRLGKPFLKKDNILMRFATNSDKKVPKKKMQDVDQYYDKISGSISKNPWGDLCKSWGIYDHQEVFNRKLLKNEGDYKPEKMKEVNVKSNKLAHRLGKRTQYSQDDDESNSDSEWNKRSKIPRMRMRADDEESKLNMVPHLQSNIKVEKDKDTYAPLSIEVINSKSSYTPRPFTKLSDKFKNDGVGREVRCKARNMQKDGIHSRLGDKMITREDDSPHEFDEYSSDDSGHIIMSRVHKVGSKSAGANVWSRLESQIQSPIPNRDLRQVLKSKKHPVVERISANKRQDLRERLGRQKKSHVHIEIYNDYDSD